MFFLQDPAIIQKSYVVKSPLQYFWPQKECTPKHSTGGIPTLAAILLAHEWWGRLHGRAVQTSRDFVQKETKDVRVQKIRRSKSIPTIRKQPPDCVSTAPWCGLAPTSRMRSQHINSQPSSAPWEEETKGGILLFNTSYLVLTTSVTDTFAMCDAYILNIIDFSIRSMKLFSLSQRRFARAPPAIEKKAYWTKYLDQQKLRVFCMLKCMNSIVLKVSLQNATLTVLILKSI